MSLFTFGKMLTKSFRADAQLEMAADAQPVVTDLWKTNRPPGRPRFLPRANCQPAD